MSQYRSKSVATLKYRSARKNSKRLETRTDEGCMMVHRHMHVLAGGSVVCGTWSHTLQLDCEADFLVLLVLCHRPRFVHVSIDPGVTD